MATYSAGILNVSGNAYFDPSGSNTASFQTVNAIVNGNMGATTLKATTLVIDSSATLTGSVSINNNLTVNGAITLNGFNNYEGNLAPGDIISYNYINTMTSTKTLAVYATAAAATGGINDTSNNISIYEIIYWGYDSRSSNLTRMSATLLIPSTIRNETIVSYKHGTIPNNYEYATLWNAMDQIIKSTSTGGNIDPGGWLLAYAGNVVVVADNPSYGCSMGFYNFLDTAGEASSQYHALCAAKQLFTKALTLAPAKFLTSPTSVISVGYSLGGMMCPFVSQLINREPSKWNLINTIAGGPVNAYTLMYQVLKNPTLKTTATVYGFNLNSSASDDKFRLSGLLPNIYTDVLPLYNQYYTNSTTATSLDTIGTAFNNSLYTKSLASVKANISPDSSNFYPTANGYYPFTVFDCSSSLSYLNTKYEYTFYTNSFISYSDLSGTPMNVIYSQGDELCCYDPSGSATGKVANDMVKPYFNGFVTNSAFTGINGVSQSPLVSLPGTPVYTQYDLLDASGVLSFTPIALKSSEGTYNCSRTSAVAALNHGQFGYRFSNTVNKYLQLR